MQSYDIPGPEVIRSNQVDIRLCTAVFNAIKGNSVVVKRIGSEIDKPEQLVIKVSRKK